MSLRFRTEKINFSLKKKAPLEKWVKRVIKKEKKQCRDIHFIFCSDAFLLKLNKEYLGHNTLTDIITFDYSQKKQLSGEIYISIARVKENTRKFKTPFTTELHRVMIHGVLHLCGYKDKTRAEKEEIRNKENRYLGILK